MDYNSNQLDYADGRAESRNKKALMRRRKGWIGFVHGYSDWVKACERGVWDNVKWNKDPKKSGAKEVRKEGNKTIYKF
jgi:hypothetical protein